MILIFSLRLIKTVILYLRLKMSITWNWFTEKSTVFVKASINFPQFLKYIKKKRRRNNGMLILVNSLADLPYILLCNSLCIITSSRHLGDTNITIFSSHVILIFSLRLIRQSILYLRLKMSITWNWFTENERHRRAVLPLVFAIFVAAVLASALAVVTLSW